MKDDFAPVGNRLINRRQADASSLDSLGSLHNSSQTLSTLAVTQLVTEDAMILKQVYIEIVASLILRV